MACSSDLRTPTRAYRAAAVVCVFLIVLVGFVAAVHFHSDSGTAADRACSVCALAHAGVLPAELHSQLLIFVPTQISQAAEPALASLLSVSAHSIRPPPAV